MVTINRTIQNERERDMAAKLVASRSMPFTITITDGVNRSNAQNRTIHGWYGEIAQQLGDMSADEVRAYCKLTIGVPIMRRDNEAYRILYDEALKPLSYQQKMSLMKEPVDMAVTSLMKTKQLSEYMERMIMHFGEQGVALTMPDDLKFQDLVKDRGKADDPTPASPKRDLQADVDREMMIECCRKLMSIPALEGLDAPAKRRALVVAKDEWKDTLRPELHDQLKAIFLSVDAQIKADAEVFHQLRESALAHFAEMLGCEVGEIS